MDSVEHASSAASDPFASADFGIEKSIRNNISPASTRTDAVYQTESHESLNRSKFAESPTSPRLIDLRKDLAFISSYTYDSDEIERVGLEIRNVTRRLQAIKPQRASLPHADARFRPGSDPRNVFITYSQSEPENDDSAVDVNSSQAATHPPYSHDDVEDSFDV